MYTLEESNESKDQFRSGLSDSYLKEILEKCNDDIYPIMKCGICSGKQGFVILDGKVSGYDASCDCCSIDENDLLENKNNEDLWRFIYGNIDLYRENGIDIHNFM